MALDTDIPMGEGMDKIIQTSVDRFAINYFNAYTDNQMAKTDRCAEELIESLCRGNKAMIDYWMGIYGAKKAELRSLSHS